MKKSDKYDYFEGKQITDPDTGKRVYEINSYRLPSVTTILGATKNQEFLKQWKAKVGEQEAERIKNVSSARGTSMHKYLESFITDVGYDDLTELGQAAKPMAEKIMEVGPCTGHGVFWLRGYVTLPGPIRRSNRLGLFTQRY